MDNHMLQLVQTMKSLYQIDLSKYDESFLKQTFEKRCKACEVFNVSDYIQFLSNSGTETQTLVSALNITYTMFFRNSLTFAYLEQWVLPQLFEQNTENRELRIWSAGCSTGQEAYSVAMLIENINEKRQKALRYRIIATDISETALASANKGEYTKEEVQNIRIRDLTTYFVKTGEMYTVINRLRKHVTFSAFDLLDSLAAYPTESIFGNFDLVICSNMLFYYKQENQKFILKKLMNAMSDQGYLVTGETERQIIVNFGGLQAVALPSPIFQKRNRGVK